jgi:hypothetical protein
MNLRKKFNKTPLVNAKIKMYDTEDNTMDIN